MVATPRDVAALAKADRDLVADLAELTATRAPVKVSALDQLAERRAAAIPETYRPAMVADQASVTQAIPIIYDAQASPDQAPRDAGPLSEQQEQQQQSGVTAC